ncbi:MAG: MarR family transcriptional regulator [Deltaproteobacteria bacterium]|nr:MAG: MarR family transcriptional regulator [Deltaproteobacteria bacterium]
MDAEDLADFEAEKRASVGQLLVKCARLVHERALARARERVDAPLRSAHLALLPHIPFEGIRQTALADALEVSKQAVGQLVGELTEFGVLALVPDPTDRRAKLVRFTAHGVAMMREGLAVFGELERELAAHVGPPAMDELRALLVRLEAALSER